MEEETNILRTDVAGEAVTAEYDTTEDTAVDYNFGGQDFGYPCTLEEVNAALDMADAERNDSTKWITSVEFHSRLEQKYPWLR